MIASVIVDLVLAYVFNCGAIAVIGHKQNSGGIVVLIIVAQFH